MKECIQFCDTDHPVLIGGDFNARIDHENGKADALVEMLSDIGFTIENQSVVALHACNARIDFYFDNELSWRYTNLNDIFNQIINAVII